MNTSAPHEWCIECRGSATACTCPHSAKKHVSVEVFQTVMQARRDIEGLLSELGGSEDTHL